MAWQAGGGESPRTLSFFEIARRFERRVGDSGAI